MPTHTHEFASAQYRTVAEAFRDAASALPGWMYYRVTTNGAEYTVRLEWDDNIPSTAGLAVLLEDIVDDIEKDEHRDILRAASEELHKPNPTAAIPWRPDW